MNPSFLKGFIGRKIALQSIAILALFTAIPVVNAQTIKLALWHQRVPAG